MTHHDPTEDSHNPDLGRNPGLETTDLEGTDIMGVIISTGW